jgi:hypothetical protein
LSEGPNVIVVTASDAASNSGSAVLNVTYSPPPPPPPVPDTPILAASGDEIDFGTEQTSKTMFVWNGGTGSFAYVIEAADGWCSVTPFDGTAQPLPSSNVHTIQVDRSSFAAGEQRETILRIRATHAAAAELIVRVYAGTRESEPPSPIPEPEPEPIPPSQPPSVDDSPDETSACGASGGCGAMGTASVLCGAITLFGLARRRRGRGIEE